MSFRFKVILTLIFMQLMSVPALAAFDCSLILGQVQKAFVAYLPWNVDLQNHFTRLLFETKELVEGNLGFNVMIETSKNDRLTRIEIKDSFGVVISYGTFFTSDSGKTLQVSYMNTEPLFYKNDLSRLVLAKMLEMNPRTTKIKTSLSQTNGELMREYIRGGDTPQEAIMKTPAYRIRQALGFSTVNWSEFIHQQYLVVEKDKP